MAWIHVDRSEVNNIDIFAFVNLKEGVTIKGRVVVGSDLNEQVLVMCEKGEFQGIIQVPSWNFFSKMEVVLKTVGIDVGTPEAVILKYIPDLTIPDEIFEQFEL